MSRKNKTEPNKISICVKHTKYPVIPFTAKHLGWELAKDENWDVFWTDSCLGIESFVRVAKCFHKINHFPGMVAIYRKNQLARSMAKMQAISNKDFSFFPKTWELPHDFKEIVKYLEVSKGSRCVIIKPSGGAQGKGIYLTFSPHSINPAMDAVVQSYVTSPLLIDGFKFDLRIYALVISCNPLRVLVYKEGLVRMCTEPYAKPDEANIDCTYMHLTNYAVNKTNANFVENNSDDAEECSSKRSLAWLWSALEGLGVDTKGVWRGICDIVVKTLISIQASLARTYASCKVDRDNNSPFTCFEVLGFDILLTDTLRPILLEVNHTPSFRTDSALDARVKRGLIYNTLTLLNADPRDKARYFSRAAAQAQIRLYGSTFSGSEKQGVARSRKATVDEQWTKYRTNERQHIGLFDLAYPTNEYAGQPTEGLQDLYDTLLAVGEEMLAASLGVKAGGAAGVTTLLGSRGGDIQDDDDDDDGDDDDDDDDGAESGVDESPKVDAPGTNAIAVVPGQGSPLGSLHLPLPLPLYVESALGDPSHGRAKALVHGKRQGEGQPLGQVLGKKVGEVQVVMANGVHQPSHEDTAEARGWKATMPMPVLSHAPAPAPVSGPTCQFQQESDLRPNPNAAFQQQQLHQVEQHKQHQQYHHQHQQHHQQQHHQQGQQYHHQQQEQQQQHQHHQHHQHHHQQHNHTIMQNIVLGRANGDIDNIWNFNVGEQLEGGEQEKGPGQGRLGHTQRSVVPVRPPDAMPASGAPSPRLRSTAHPGSSFSYFNFTDVRAEPVADEDEGKASKQPHPHWDPSHPWDSQAHAHSPAPSERAQQKWEPVGGRGGDLEVRGAVDCYDEDCTPFPLPLALPLFSPAPHVPQRGRDSAGVSRGPLAAGVVCGGERRGLSRKGVDPHSDTDDDELPVLHQDRVLMLKRWAEQGRGDDDDDGSEYDDVCRAEALVEDAGTLRDRRSGSSSSDSEYAREGEIEIDVWHKDKVSIGVRGSHQQALLRGREETACKRGLGDAPIWPSLGPSLDTRPGVPVLIRRSTSPNVPVLRSSSGEASVSSTAAHNGERDGTDDSWEESLPALHTHNGGTAIGGHGNYRGGVRGHTSTLRYGDHDHLAVPTVARVPQYHFAGVGAGAGLGVGVGVKGNVKAEDCARGDDDDDDEDKDKLRRVAARHAQWCRQLSGSSFLGDKASSLSSSSSRHRPAPPSQDRQSLSTPHRQHQQHQHKQVEASYPDVEEFRREYSSYRAEYMDYYRRRRKSRSAIPT